MDPEHPGGSQKTKGLSRGCGGETVLNGFQKGKRVGRGAPIEETDGRKSGMHFQIHNHAVTCFDREMNRILRCSFLFPVLLTG